MKNNDIEVLKKIIRYCNDIEFEIVWNTLIEDIPNLKEQINELI